MVALREACGPSTLYTFRLTRTFVADFERLHRINNLVLGYASFLLCIFRSSDMIATLNLTHLTDVKKLR